MLTLALLLIHIAYPWPTIDAVSIGLIVLLLAIPFVPFATAVSIGGFASWKVDPKLRESEKSLKESIGPEKARELDKPPPEGRFPGTGFDWEEYLQVDTREFFIRLRTQIEGQVNSLVEAGGMQSAQGPRATYANLYILEHGRFVTASDRDAVESLLAACNSAIHGNRATRRDAERAATIGFFLSMLLNQRIDTAKARRSQTASASKPS